MSKPNERLEAIFEAALALKTGAQRAEYLSRACPDPEMRKEAESLLAAHANPDSVFVDQTTRAEQRASEQVGTVIGRYKLLEKLGEGGFGAVWLGEQKEPVRRKVALKLIKAGMDSRQVVARFEAERQALALMDHPNIAKVLDADATDHGRPYFVMELVRGTPITKFCDENKLTARERLGLFIKVCHAVQHAHQKGIVHRDIKPSNVLVTLHDGVPVPKIIDFGIAKAMQQELTDKTLHTMFQQFIGTPAYVSPEQAEMSGLDIDTRSDIYSLGVLLYELLAGVTPFDGNDLLASGLDAMRRTIREKEPPRPSTRVNTLPAAQRNTTASQRSTEPGRLASLLRGDLDWIVMKCLEKDRDRRYETATGLARDVERHLANEPVTARPPSTVYRLQKMVRRNKLPFAAGSAVAAALVIGLALALIGMKRERLAKQRALAAEQGAVMARNSAESQRERAKAAEEQAAANLELARENASTARQLLYDADINLAHKALQSKHLGLARRLLARHVPAGGIGKASLSEAFALGGEDVPLAANQATNDLRGWEWRYLWQQSQSLASRLCKMPTGISGLSFAPNGDWLAVTTLGGRRAELWSRLQGRRLHILTTNGCGAAQNWQTAFSPVAPVLAIGLAKGTVLVTNLETGANWVLQTGTLLGDTNMMADKLAFSPDGRYLAALGGHRWGTEENGALFVWETQKFVLVSTNTSGRIADSYAAGTLAWAPTSKSIWIGATDSSITETPVSGGSPVLRGAATIKSGGLTLAVSSSGEALATSSPPDPTLEVWSIRDGRTLANPRSLVGHAAYVSCLTYSPDGNWLASASCDQTIRLWNTTDWQSVELRGHTEEVHALAFTPDGRVLASGSRDGEVLLWPLESVNSLREHQKLPPNVDAAVIAPGSRNLLAKLKDKSLALIDARTLAATPLPFAPTESKLLEVTGVAAIADGADQLVFIEANNQGWRVLSQTEGGSAVLQKPYALLGRMVAFISGSNTVTCIPVDDASRRFQLTAGADVTELVKLGFRGPQLFGRDRNGGIHFWDLQERRVVRQASGLAPQIQVLSQPELPDLVCFDQSDPERRAVEFRDLAFPEKILRRFVIPYTILHEFKFSPGGQLLAMSIQDTGSLLLFDLPSRSLKRSLQRHLMAVRGPRFSTDGKRLASCGSSSDAVKLWDVETGQELMSLPANINLNSFVQFSDDQNLILGQGWCLWRAPSWEEIQTADRAVIERQSLRAKAPASDEMQEPENLAGRGE